MDALRIVWKKRALQRVEEIALWYERNMGYTAERHFLEGINDVVCTLSKSPLIGKIDYRRNNKQHQLYSFVAHPKYTIVYYFNSRTIYIVTIYRSLMKHG